VKVEQGGRVFLKKEPDLVDEGLDGGNFVGKTSNGTSVRGRVSDLLGEGGPGEKKKKKLDGGGGTDRLAVARGAKIGRGEKAGLGKCSRGCKEKRRRAWLKPKVGVVHPVVKIEETLNSQGFGM